MNQRYIDIHRPTAQFGLRASSSVFTLDRPIKGLRVGMRTDFAWRSWQQIAAEWSEMLKADGAEPVIIQVGEHTGEGEGTRTLRELDAWAGSVDCGIVGLAN